MRLIAGLVLALVAVTGFLAWKSGAHLMLLWWVAERQQALQAALAGRIQDLRTGSSAAFWSLLALCAAYGFLHALGPGHGKMLVAGAAIGTRATALRMGAIAVLGSLGQAVVAILVVYGGFALFEATARGTVDAADRWIAPLGNLAVALVGVWLLARGLRALRPAAARAHADAQGCGHDHGPSPEAVARANGLVVSLALVGAIAARPCTGALVVLVIAWRMGLQAAGAAAAVAMGLGTAAFTLLIAALAVASRDAAFLTAGDGRMARLIGPCLQILAGGLVLAVGGALFGSALLS